MICEEHVKRFCKDFTKIENYDKAMADTTQVWDCHHRMETHNSDGEKRLVDLSRPELKALGMYYDQPPEELIFLTREEHIKLHHKGKKRAPFSEEWKAKLSAANKGEKNPMYGKHHSDETKARMSASGKGRHWYNNGNVSTMAFECPEGFVPGRL